MIVSYIVDYIHKTRNIPEIKAILTEEKQEDNEWVLLSLIDYEELEKIAFQVIGHVKRMTCEEKVEIIDRLIKENKKLNEEEKSHSIRILAILLYKIIIGLKNIEDKVIIMKLVSLLIHRDKEGEIHGQLAQSHLLFDIISKLLEETKKYGSLEDIKAIEDV